MRGHHSPEGLAGARDPLGSAVATDNDLTTGPVAAPGSGAALLRSYIARLNHGVRSGDFTSMLAELTRRCPAGVRGHPGRAVQRQGGDRGGVPLAAPDDELELLGVDEDGHGGASGTYAWSQRPGVVAGEVQVTTRGGRIARVLVRYGDDGRSRQQG
jgi:hypothetical protein